MSIDGLEHFRPTETFIYNCTEETDRIGIPFVAYDANVMVYIDNVPQLINMELHGYSVYFNPPIPKGSRILVTQNNKELSKLDKLKAELEVLDNPEKIQERKWKLEEAILKEI